MNHMKHILRSGAVLAIVAVLSMPAAHARQITMCTLNWEPFYGAELPRNGFFTELVREAFERGGHTVNVEFMPWARAMLEVEQGDREVLLGAYYSDERAQTYHASDSIYTAEVGLVAHRRVGIESFASLRDLTGYTIGYGRGFTVTEEFDNADYLDKEPAKDLAQNVKKLYAGRIDMIAGSFANIRYAAQQQEVNMDELVFLQPALVENSLHIMISRAAPDGEQLLADFHRGLREIREDGTYERILRDMGYL